MKPMPKATRRDGPLMRWILAHGLAYVTDETAQKFFGKDVGVFRNARDSGGQYFANQITIRIEDVSGYIELLQTTQGYRVYLRLQSAWLCDYYRNGQEPTLSLFIDEQMPLSVSETFIGQKAGQIISLPAPVQTIIADKTVLSAEKRGQANHFELS